VCFILLGLKTHPYYPFIVAANRDEFYARPAKAAEFWDDNSNILAGRDLKGGGTWLGLNRRGRFAALTNFRNPGSHDPIRESRGQIVTAWLNSDNAVPDFLRALATCPAKYNGFCLLAGDLRQVYFYSNYAGAETKSLTEGIYALSNHLLDTPWPKAIKGKQQFENIVNTRKDDLADALLELLADKSKAPDAHLPDTGIDPELERDLSPIFIQTPDYGTRCSTVILTDHNGRVEFIERTFDNDNIKTITHLFEMTDIEK
jgi:uncharacterized protein with NRDE domain